MHKYPHRMVLEKLADGKAVTEEEMDLLLDLVGPEVGVLNMKKLMFNFLNCKFGGGCLPPVTHPSSV